jgi:hypothetical protein
MKKRTLLILLIFYTFLSKAQEYRVQWGNEEKIPRKSILKDVLAYDREHFYTLRYYYDKEQYQIEKYSHRFQKEAFYDIPKETSGGVKNYEFAFQVADILYIFSSVINVERGKDELYMEKLNKKSMTIAEAPAKLGSISIPKTKSRVVGQYGYSISRDSSKILIYYSMPPILDVPERFILAVFNQKMEALWAEDISMTHMSIGFFAENFLIDDAGTVIVKGRKYFLDSLKSCDDYDLKQIYKHHIAVYQNQGKEVFEVEIDSDDKHLFEMKVAIDLSNQLICAGFYSDSTNCTLDGSYFIKIDIPSKSIVRYNYEALPESFRLIEYQNNGIYSKRLLKLYESKLRDLIPKSDGSAILIAEQYYPQEYLLSTRISCDGINYRPTSTYFHNDILLVNISESGSIEWTNKIAKRQLSLNDRGFFNSFAIMVKDNTLNFIFNEHNDNLKPVSGQLRTMFYKDKTNSHVALVSVDLMGKRKRTTLYFGNKYQILTIPKLSKQLAYNKLVIFGERRKVHRYAFLSIE